MSIEQRKDLLLIKLQNGNYIVVCPKPTLEFTMIKHDTSYYCRTGNGESLFRMLGVFSPGDENAAKEYYKIDN